MKRRQSWICYCALLITSVSACSGPDGRISTMDDATNRSIPATAVSPSRQATFALVAIATQPLGINSGGSKGSGTWVPDVDYSSTGSSGTTLVHNAIDTSKVTSPAPQAIYQSQRYATHLQYVIPNLTAGAAYAVRMHFVESYFSSAGKRVFSAKINGVSVLSNFNIFQVAGGANIAIVQQFATSADAKGTITLGMDATVNNVSIAGIEIVPGGLSTPAPAVSPSPVPSPVPSTNAPGFGPRVAVGPQPSIACPAGSVNVLSSSSVQSIVNSHAAGTTYCLASGTFAQQQIKPKANDKYIGELGAILDGQNIATYAFTGAAQGVTIENLVIKNYNTAAQNAPINPGWAGGGAITNWSVTNNEIVGNRAAGIYSGGGDHIVANYIHDNGQEGYAADGTGAIYTDNIIADNNFLNTYCKISSTAECGGGKAWATTNFTISYNFIHDNHGPGIWDDTDNQGTVIEHNDIENNWMSGIMHEISWDATIQSNYVANNANPSSQYCPLRNYWCAEIFITNSGGVGGKVVDVSENVLKPNAIDGGVMLLNCSRGTSTTYPSRGPWLVQNVTVHNNTISMISGSIVGAFDQDRTDAAMFTKQGNSFDYDAYTGSAGAAPFYWDGAGTFAGFQAKNQELHGSLQ